MCYYTVSGVTPGLHNRSILGYFDQSPLNMNFNKSFINQHESSIINGGQASSQETVNPQVPGSSPGRGAKQISTTPYKTMCCGI
jgi:hypothetical protein